MTPAFSVSVGAVGARVNDRLLALEVVDQEGNRSDSCRIEIDDRNGLVQIPDRGANISIQMGYRETGLQDMGSFIVDEVTANGWPQKLLILGRSADLTNALKSPRSFSYKDMTLGQVVQQIASRHGLSGSASGAVGSLKYKHLAQTEESDMNFLTRLAMRHDALFAVKNGQIIFKKRGESMGGSATVRHPGNLLEYRVTFQDRQAFGSGLSEWWDRQKAARTRESGSGGSGSASSMATPLAEDGQQQATDMAGSTGSSHSRMEKIGEFTIIGDPTIRAEMSISVSGVKPGVDGSYRVKAVTHQLSNQGYRTTIIGESM
jgi:phage protein D